MSPRTRAYTGTDGVSVQPKRGAVVAVFFGGDHVSVSSFEDNNVIQRRIPM